MELLPKHPNVLVKVPNRAVAMDAWARSACYPRGNFYPLINVTLTRTRWFTTAHFRVCSDCSPYSQAGLCSYTSKPDFHPG